MTGTVLRCWFCDRPAWTVGWGFAVCGQGAHAERARLLGNPDLDADRRARALDALTRAESERPGS